MMRRGAASASLLAVLLLLVGTMPSAPAGATGGPECGLSLLPCEIGPGYHDGTLQPHVNERDHYVFTPPEEPAVIRITATANAEVEVLLFDPDGKLRAAASNWAWPEMHLDAIAQPAGEWRLEIGYFFFGYGPLFGNNYLFSLGYESFDHVGYISAPGGDARTIEALLPRGEDARVEFVYTTPGPLAFSSSVAYVETLLVNGDDFAWGYGRIGSGCCGFLGPDVKTWGVLPEDIHIGLPLPGLSGSSLGALGAENHGQAVRLAFGFAVSWGLDDVDIWTVWNGDESPVVTLPDGDAAFFLTLADFEGDGPGILAGPYAYVEDVSATVSVPSMDTHLTVFEANGYSPALALYAPDMTLERPDGERIDVSGQWDAFFWWDAMAGDWRFDVHHLDGYEADRILFAGAHFPMTFEGIFAPLP